MTGIGILNSLQRFDRNGSLPVKRLYYLYLNLQQVKKDKQGGTEVFLANGH